MWLNMSTIVGFIGQSRYNCLLNVNLLLQLSGKLVYTRSDILDDALKDIFIRGHKTI